MKHTMRWTLLLLGLATGLPAGLGAAVVLPVDLAELARNASVVAVGTVVETEARWTENRRAVETIVTLSPQSYLKGGSGETVRFRVPGGTFGRYRTFMPGAPEFSVGQHVIVFLSGRVPAVPHLLGLSQGVFRLVPTDSGWVVTPPGPYAAGRTAQRVARGHPDRQPMPLAEFEQEVRAMAEEVQ
jgi:hypothetical protein